jgi:hypothetical protein
VINETETDILGMAELNINFKMLGSVSQWLERFRNLYRNHSVHSYNRHDSSTKRTLFRGTAQIAATGAFSHQADKSGADETGLGCWVWTLFAGKNNVKLRVISGYRPNPDLSVRPGTVYSQQERYLQTINDFRDPRRAFIKDLEAKLEQWITEGNLIVIGIDTNDNVRTGDVNAMMRNKGLIEVHSQRHPQLPRASTCNKTTRISPSMEYGHLSR